MVALAGRRILRSRTRLDGLEELRAYAEKLGATIVYGPQPNSGTLNRGGYIIAQFHTCDPTGW